MDGNFFSLTKCAGFSTPRWARNSARTYSSPSSRIRGCRCLRWERRIRRYSVMGGSSAIGGDGRPGPPPLGPPPIAVASRRRVGLMLLLLCMYVCM